MNFLNNLITWCRRHSLAILRCSLGIVFLWFGILKLLPFIGEAEDIGYRTLHWLSGNRLQARPALTILGITEILIGVGLLLKKGMPLVLLLLFLQLAGTLLPLVIFKEETWNGWFMPSLSGHYIIKNIVFIAAGMVLTGTVNKPSEPDGQDADAIAKAHKK